MIPKKKLQIFVSSTYKDLIRERQIAVEAILKAGHIPAGMELFSAGDQEQWEIIKKWIDESDVLLLILGGRYGSIEPVSGKSYTQLEYEYAKESGKPFFAVVAKDEYLSQKSKAKDQDPKEIYEFDNQVAFKGFKSQVQGKMCAFWEDEKELKLEIFSALLDFNNRDSLVGWVRGNMAVNGGALAEEMARLAKENFELRMKISDVTPEMFVGLTFSELINLLENEKIELVSDNNLVGILDGLRSVRNNLGGKEINLLHFFLWFKNEFTGGDTIYYYNRSVLRYFEDIMKIGLIERVAIYEEYGYFNLTNDGLRFLNKLKVHVLNGKV